MAYDKGNTKRTKVMNWQPIETAPKTPFDILGTDGRWVGMMGWCPIRDGEYGWVTPTGYQVEPTHWMNMPKPPKEIE